MTWEMPSYCSGLVQYVALDTSFEGAVISHILLAKMLCAMRIKSGFLRVRSSLASAVNDIMNFPKVYNLNQLS